MSISAWPLPEANSTTIMIKFVLPVGNLPSMYPRPQRLGKGPGHTCKKFPYVLCQQSSFGVEESHCN